MFHASLLIASGNPSKTHELASSLADLPYQILSLADLPSRPPEPPEDGETFEENAAIKAEFWCKQTNLTTLADDSGILVDALPGELGVRTVRFGAGAQASDEEWLKHFLERLKDVPKEKRGARFVSVIAVAQPNKKTEFFRGEVLGKILEKPAAPLKPRIPLSSIFLADGAPTVFAAMTAEEKARWSHRGRAISEAKKYLAGILK